MRVNREGRGVTFAIDRDGKVTSSAITAASNNALLDREALAMIHRAEPFPPPSTIGKDAEEFATAIKFKLFSCMIRKSAKRVSEKDHAQ